MAVERATRELFLGEGGAGSQNLYVNMGPAHPAMHGIIRIFAELDGEMVVKADVEIGYLHRAFEKDCEAHVYGNAIPFTDRLNYVSPLINNFGYASAVEKLLGIEITERCKYIRVIMSEIPRICDHLTCVGASAMELGAFTVFLYMIKAREFLWELVEDVTGARLTISYGRIGGVKADLPAGFDLKVKKAFPETRQVLEEVHKLITGNRIFMDRMVGVGALSRADTIAWGITGPLLRAAGVPFDLRKMQPYWAYDRMDFEVPLGRRTETTSTATSCAWPRWSRRCGSPSRGSRAFLGAPSRWTGRGGRSIPTSTSTSASRGRPRASSSSRSRSRRISRARTEALTGASTCRTSASCCRRRSRLRIHRGTDEPLHARHGRVRCPAPARGSVFPVEGANGELGFYVVSDGSDRPYRLRCRPPCLPPVAALPRMIEGQMIADVIPTFGSVNMIGGELDR